jgi:ribosome-binding factor A
MPSRRMLRINSIIRDELAELMSREIQDPRLGGVISITEVETADDLSICHIYVSVLADEDKARETLNHLRHAASFFRKEIAARINLRHTPEMDFRLDRSIAEGQHLMDLMRGIERERAAREAEQGAAE